MIRDALLALSIFVIIIGVLLGILLFPARHTDDQPPAEHEDELQAQWNALQQAQRLDMALFQARTAMRDEVLRQMRRPPE